jgi:hypothetical protein
MKRVIAILVGIFCILLVILNLTTNNSIPQTDSNTKSIPQTDSNIITKTKTQEEDLRQVIWDKLSQESKAEIIGTWKDAKMEKVIGNKQRSYLKDARYDGKELFHIVFSTNRDNLLGPIGVYIDPETKEIVGGDLRE